MSKNKPTHGGSRSGAGRPPKPRADKLHPYTVWLTKRMADALTKLGGGNIGAGVRALAEKYLPKRKGGK